MITLPPECLQCRHFDENAPISAPVCAAYPKGIPSLIWLGELSHRDPLPNDNGIQFEQLPTE